MSDFIDLTDYPSSIHTEILNAITRNDPTVIDIAESSAVEQMIGYLSSRYNTDQIFNKRGDQRNPILLMFAKDIVIYDLFSAHNPQKLSENRVLRYDRAIKWLESVQKCLINPPGLPLLAPQEERGKIISSSNPKRNTHF